MNPHRPFEHSGLLTLIALSALSPGWGIAAARQTTAGALLATVPALPTQVQAAYALWTDEGGDLKAGPAFKSVAEAIQSATAQAQSLRLDAAPSAQPSHAATRPVSSQEQTLLGHIGTYPGGAAVQQAIQSAHNAQTALEQRWKQQIQALERQENQARSALAPCRGETGEPSQTAIRDLALRFADQKIALADRYLPQFASLADQLRAAVGPRIEFGDSAMSAWRQLGNPAGSRQLAGIAAAAQSNAYADVGLVNLFVESVSKQGARAIADKKTVLRIYANARGC